MRYRSFKSGLALLSEYGDAKYTFQNYVLIVGDPTLDTAGNVIITDVGGTDPKSAMQTPYPLAGTDLEKVGLGKFFIKAPPITSTGTLDNGTVTGPYYELITGSADLANAAYVGKYEVVLPANLSGLTAGPGVVIKVTADITVPADGSTWALAPSPEYLEDEDHDMRPESFIMNNLTTFKDESSWNPTTWGSKTQDPKTVRN